MGTRSRPWSSVHPYGTRRRTHNAACRYDGSHGRGFSVRRCKSIHACMRARHTCVGADRLDLTISARMWAHLPRTWPICRWAFRLALLYLVQPSRFWACLQHVETRGFSRIKLRCVCVRPTDNAMCKCALQLLESWAPAFLGRPSVSECFSHVHQLTITPSSLSLLPPPRSPLSAPRSPLLSSLSLTATGSVKHRARPDASRTEVRDKSQKQGCWVC